MEVRVKIPKGVPKEIIKSRVEFLVRGEVSRFQLLEEIIKKMSLNKSDLKEFEKTREALCVLSCNYFASY